MEHPEAMFFTQVPRQIGIRKVKSVTFGNDRLARNLMVIGVKHSKLVHFGAQLVFLSIRHVASPSSTSTRPFFRPTA